MRQQLTINEKKYGIVPIRTAICKAHPHATLGLGFQNRYDVIGTDPARDLIEAR
jgi:hypothetical protein